MSQDILIIETVDVRRADDPEDSKVFTLTKVGLPKLKRKKAEHTPGGGVGSVNFLLPMLDAFEPTFSTKGLDLQVLREFGFAAGKFDRWTFAASLRNKRTRALLPVRFTIEGIVSDWSPGDHTPGELLDCDHTMDEVTYMDLKIDGELISLWDFYGRQGISGGEDWFAEYRAALGV